MLYGRVIATSLLSFLAMIFFASDSFAIPKLKLDAQKPSSPTVIKADSVYGDKAKNTLTATGNVEANKGNSTVYADEMVYYKSDHLIKAKGDVRIKNIEIGNVKASRAEVKDDFSSGKFLDSQMFFNDGSYLFSQQIERKNPLVTVLQKPIYSICPNPEISADNDMAGKKRDFFSIKSKETTIDRDQQVMKIKGGVIRLYNNPVFYVPYFKVPLPSSGRKSGFLTPSYVKSSNLGTGIKVPYYFNIAPNMDLTATPFISLTSSTLMLNNDFRHMTSYGEYRTNFEIANNKITSTADTTVTDRTDNPYRWHLTGTGIFDFTKNSGLDFDLNTVGDRNYLRDYYFNYLNYSISKVNLDYIHGRDYYSIKSIRIQELEYSDSEKSAPFILPSIDSHIESKPRFFKEKFALTSNFTAITREDGLQYRRATAIPEVNLPFNLSGNLFNLNGKVQGDFYSLENNFQGSKTNNYEDFKSNYKPESSLSWKLPLIKKSRSYTLLVEPMANLVSSSYYQNFTELPDEDSNSSELTVSNLFTSDRIYGFDRNESGERISYGVKSSLFNKYGEFGLTIGQSYRRSGAVQDVSITGFNDNNKSNLVGQALYKAEKYFSAIYSFQLNESSYRNEINQLTTSLVFDRFNFYSDYLLVRTSNQNSTAQEQLSFSSEVKVTNRWKVGILATKDLVTQRMIYRGINFYRDGCCTTFGFSLLESHPSTSTKSQKTFNISLSFKNL